METKTFDFSKNKDEETSKLNFCELHKNYEITNICINSSCFTYLCPDCINKHNEYHYLDNSQSQVVPVNGIKQNFLGLFNFLKEKVLNEKKSLNNFSNYGYFQKEIKEKFYRQKQIILDELEYSFRLIENEIDNNLNNFCSNSHKNKIIDEKIGKILTKLGNIQKKLNSENFLKPLLKVK